MHELRLYTFCNFYLSSIQAGIQSAHLVGELRNQYNNHPLFDEWCKNYKTMIVCNGGSQKDLVDAWTDFLKKGVSEQFPMACFCEESGALAPTPNAMTCFGIIVPEYIYNAEIQYIKTTSGEHTYYVWICIDGHAETRQFEPDSIEAFIYNFIKSKDLAR